ncbi:MAG: type III secretion system export apparatus subunit SctT [Endozoicomonadaceae bacterium]|nr:type III secretion system export apparatus subunit SctT [Endozoicomonadaceae bacterium]
MLLEMKNFFYVYSLSMVRLMAAFASFPLLNRQALGGNMIRNGIVGVLALFLLPLTLSQVPETKPPFMVLFGLMGKEVFLGMLMGFIANIPFWAVEASGFFIDNQRGASMASTLNPLSGSESSPTGILFSQTFIAIYIISGVFFIMLGTVLNSYQIWPLFSFFPTLNIETASFILNQFDTIITLAVWLAAPIIIAMFITEFGIALISRSAPQLNVFILAMPIKSAVAVWILSLYIVTLMSLGKEYSTKFPIYIKKLTMFFM